MYLPSATVGAFFDEMEKIGGWRNVLADASIPLGVAALGAGIGAIGSGEGDRLSGARKGALIGGGIGTGLLAGSRGLDAVNKALLKRRLNRVSDWPPPIPPVVDSTLFASSGVLGGVAGHKLDKKIMEKTGGWRSTLSSALSKVPLDYMALGAGFGALTAGEGNRLHGARSGAMVGAGVGLGYQHIGRGLNALQRKVYPRVKSMPRIEPDLLRLSGGVLGGAAAHKLNKAIDRKVYG